MTVVILGCGYTGERVAQRMINRGARVLCTSRTPERLQAIRGAEALRLELPGTISEDLIPEGSLVVHSIPPVDGQDPAELVRSLGSKPRRLVYLSTTGVYGDQQQVDASTPAAPRNDREWQRIETENAVQAGPWSAIVLRPAAIYGPDRGIHVSMAEGRFRLVDGGANFVSRIHVDDLADHVEAALMSDVTGAWPVADDHPCTSIEIATYCATMLGVPVPSSIDSAEAHHTRRADRKVDGRAIRELLGIRLRYPSYQSGLEGLSR